MSAISQVSISRPVLAGVMSVLLVLFGPEVEVFDAFQPPLVVERAGELAEPGTHAVGDGVEDPDADFGVAGDAGL